MCQCLRMPRPSPLPPVLGSAFSVASATDRGVTPRRLRASDLASPFRGVRALILPDDPAANRFEQERVRELGLIRALAQRMTETQFISHRSAALLWGVPLPHRREPDLHLASLSPARAPRIRGVRGHSVEPDRCEIVVRDGIRMSSAASTWVMLGSLGLSMIQLVAAGDHLVRRYRFGHGRPHAGRAPHTTLGELSKLLGLGGWSGAPALRLAHTLTREDSWSPRESIIRVQLILAGLPEPELNVDVFADDGSFLACIDMVYPSLRVGVEYHGMQHGERYAFDVERMARLRAAGWEMIEVTHALVNRPGVVAQRVKAALRQRGWTPGQNPHDSPRPLQRGT